VNVNFLNDKDKLLQAQRRTRARQWLKRGLLALSLAAALLLAWHERPRLTAWLSEPAAPVSNGTRPPAEPEIEVRAQPEGTTVYSWRDEHGVRSFSDRPPAPADRPDSARQGGRGDNAAASPASGPAPGRLARCQAWIRAHWPWLSPNKLEERQTNQ